jgi:hypothetical protein
LDRQWLHSRQNQIRSLIEFEKIQNRDALIKSRLDARQYFKGAIKGKLPPVTGSIHATFELGLKASVYLEIPNFTGYLNARTTTHNTSSTHFVESLFYLHEE